MCYVSWKAECKSNELAYLSEELSKQNVESAAYLLLVVYSKIQKDENKLKTEFIIIIKGKQNLRFRKSLCITCP